MTEPRPADFAQAIRDFRRARQKAALEEVMARLTGHSSELMSFDEVRDRLRATNTVPRGLREVPVDAIVGSVGRYSDFTRTFLPRGTADEERWARVRAAAEGLEGLPPIEVYKVGDAYFVKDGHHRVSVARELGTTLIEAYVTEVDIRVPFGPDTSPEELIIKAEYADFLAQTHLDQLRPGADLSVSEPGRYPQLQEHIGVHRYFMGIEDQREIPYKEAVSHWFDTVYRPVVEVIRQLGILRDFPDRTETDLYLWVMEHRAELGEHLGWDVDTEQAAAHLAEAFGESVHRVAERWGGRLLGSLVPDGLAVGPAPGSWRARRRTLRRHSRLFSDILVPIRGDEVGWLALDQAIRIAKKEGGRLRGLHVLPEDSGELEQRAQSVLDQFDETCRRAGVTGSMALDHGPTARRIAERAIWADLIVLSLVYPPEPQGARRLASGFRALVRACPRPILAVSEKAVAPQSALLAYDGSPKAVEALYVATYITGAWKLKLTVVTATGDESQTGKLLDEARGYLERRLVRAEYVGLEGATSEAILQAAEARRSDWILMGGYGAGPLVEVMMGSAVDEVLRQAGVPVLICR